MSEDLSMYSDYVQSMFDVEYKNVYDRYMELTGDTEEASQGYYDTNMAYWAAALADYYQIVLINDEVEADMIAFTEEVFTHVNYEVKAANAADDYYTVEVVVSPMIFSEHAYDDATAFLEDFMEKSDAGEYGDYQNDEDDYIAWEVAYAEGLIPILESHIADITYDDPVSKIVKVTVNDEGYYGFSDEDYSDIEGYFLY